MAGISDLFVDLLARITTTIPTFKFVHIWNNQLTQLEDGLTYAFPFPNCFVEILTPNDYTPVLRGYSVGELIVRIHIGHEQYDAGGGNMEQNLDVFNLRNQVVNKLNNYQPIATSSLMKSSEGQDYVHTNVYHYTIDFRCAFIDSWGGWEAQHVTTNGIIHTLQEEIEIAPPFAAGIFDDSFDYTFN
jgi:hypothetical protein